jgi:hypothetical protein
MPNNTRATSNIISRSVGHQHHPAGATRPTGVARPIIQTGCFEVDAAWDEQLHTVDNGCVIVAEDVTSQQLESIRAHD